MDRSITMAAGRNVSHDAEALPLREAAGGGGAQLVRAADEQVTCGGVTAALGANVRGLRYLSPSRSPQRCGEEEEGGVRPDQPGFMFVCLFFTHKPSVHTLFVKLKSHDETAEDKVTVKLLRAPSNPRDTVSLH
ncbi:hypothetical protein INR49_019741 [Caranx melampygus]|nr:hypothetical protein INR49_019741 [Caranx melampygus]